MIDPRLPYRSALDALRARHSGETFGAILWQLDDTPHAARDDLPAGGATLYTFDDGTGILVHTADRRIEPLVPRRLS